MKKLLSNIHALVYTAIAIGTMLDSYTDGVLEDNLIAGSQYAMSQMIETGYQDAVDKECGSLRSGVWKAVKGDEVINKRLDKAYLETMK